MFKRVIRWSGLLLFVGLVLFGRNIALQIAPDRAAARAAPPGTEGSTPLTLTPLAR